MARGLARSGVMVLAVAVAVAVGLPVWVSPGWLSPGRLSLSKPPPVEDIRWSRPSGWVSLSKPPWTLTAATSSGARVLEHWDRERAAAYAAGDARPLRRLYVPGSVAGDRDVRLLMSYAERGLVVTGMRMRLLSMYAISDRSHRLVLRVRDRLVRATARSRFEPSVHLRLPTDHPSTHEVTLVRRPRRAWQVSQVR